MRSIQRQQKTQTTVFQYLFECFKFTTNLKICITFAINVYIYNLINFGESAKPYSIDHHIGRCRYIQKNLRVSWSFRGSTVYKLWLHRKIQSTFQHVQEIKQHYIILSKKRILENEGTTMSIFTKCSSEASSLANGTHSFSCVSFPNIAYILHSLTKKWNKKSFLEKSFQKYALQSIRVNSKSSAQY